MRLSKNVYQVLGGMYGSHQNVYAVDCGNELVLIDSGKDSCDWDIINQKLKYWDLFHKPISYVLLTHSHCEHSGNASRFEAFGSCIIGHPLCAKAIQEGNDRTASFAFFEFDKFSVCTHPKTMNDGDVLKVSNSEFQMIYAPGHSQDSVIYKVNVDGNEVMFTGDTLLNGDLCLESEIGWTGGVDFNQKELIKSLISLSTKKADFILPGHGEVCLMRGDRMLVGAYLKARLLLSTQPSISLINDNNNLYWR